MGVVEAIVVVSRCNQHVLEAAHVLTINVALFLSTMLKINSSLMWILSDVILHEAWEHREKPNFKDSFPTQCTWHSSQSLRSNWSRLRFTSRQCLEWVETISSVSCAIFALCQSSLSVCLAILALVRAALPVLLMVIGPAIALIVTVKGFLNSTLSTMKTITGYSAQVLAIIWDLSSF